MACCLWKWDINIAYSLTPSYNEVETGWCRFILLVCIQCTHRLSCQIIQLYPAAVPVIIIIIIRQFIRRRNMSVKSLQGRHTTYATRVKLMKLEVQNTTVKTNESWADSWRCRVLVQIECRSADCSTPHIICQSLMTVCACLPIIMVHTVQCCCTKSCQCPCWRDGRTFANTAGD